MFGVIAAGRLVNNPRSAVQRSPVTALNAHLCCCTFPQVSTNFQQAGQNQFITSLENVSLINHIVVFLTGDVPFSDGFGGSIYFGWPTGTGEVAWQFLGYITNDKPSAIFKLGRVRSEDAVLQNPFMAAQGHLLAMSNTSALLGISVEPQNDIAQKTPADNTTASGIASQTEFCQKMLENFYNFASSFAVTQQQMSPAPNVPFVPLSTVTQWFENFQRKMSANPNFWKT